MKKEKTLKEKIAEYAAVTSAILAMSKDSNAQIVYTDVMPDFEISNGQQYIDLNNDGLVDFKLQQHLNSWDAGNYEHGSSGFVFSQKNICLSANQNMVSSYYNQLIALEISDTINQNKIFSVNSILQYDMMSAEWWSSVFNYSEYHINNVSGTDKIIGLKVISGGQTNYGWARLDVLNAKIVLKDYAINAIPDSAILAGDIGSPCNIGTPTVNNDSEIYLCNGDSLAVNLYGTNGLTVQWINSGAWITGATDTSFTITQPGSYQALISDSNCAVIIPSVKAKSVSINNIYEDHSEATCGEANAGIDITISGSAPGFTYLWNTGATTQDLNNISTGTYHLTVTTTVCSISKTDSVIVGGTSAIELSEIHTDSACVQGGSILVLVSGGTPGYGYEWNDGSHDKDRYNLSPGYYRLTVTDSYDCSESISVGIIACKQPQVLVEDKKVLFLFPRSIPTRKFIVICNDLAQTVATKEIGTENPMIDLSNFVTGVYFYYINDEEKYKKLYSGKFLLK